MNLPDKIISICKLCGMSFGTYLGYNKGYIVKDYLDKYLRKDFNYISSYKDYKNNINDKHLYNMIGGFTGLFFGYHLWMFIIPYSLANLKVIK